MITITDEMVEIASKAGYKVTQKKATKYYAGTQLDRFIPWEEISEDWRKDYKSVILAALETLNNNG